MATEQQGKFQVDEAAIRRTVESLKGRNVEAVVAQNGDEARQILIDMIPDGAEVFKSTSETLDTIGYSEYIRETDRYKNLSLEVSAEPDRERQRELRRLPGWPNTSWAASTQLPRLAKCWSPVVQEASWGHTSLTPNM